MLDMLMSRTRFHQWIWTNPHALVLSKLGIGENAFFELCRDNRIPAPPGPAWTKPGFGNRPSRARLPKRDLGENSFVFFAGDFTPDEQQAYRHEVLSEMLEDPGPMAARFRKRLARINEHDDPFRLHPAIEGVVEPLPRAANDNPASEARWAEQRRFNLLNEIFLYVEALGGYCRSGGDAGHQHMIRIGHVNVFFTLTAPDDHDKLRLEIVSRNDLAGVRLCWGDTSATALENILPDVMVEMGVAAETILRRQREDWRASSPISASERPLRTPSTF